MNSIQKTRSRSARTLVATASLALITAVVALPATAPAGAASPQHAAAVKPTVVLVHGAWADSSSWKRVVRRLQALGYTVAVAPNPLRSLAGDAAYLASYLSTIPGPIVLVGHSYGGAVVTNAATGNQNVKALVYVDAFVPDEGESVVQLASEYPGSALAVADPHEVFNLVPYPGAPEGDADLYVLPQVFRTAFANDLGSRDAAVLASTQRPVTFSALATPSAAPAWQTIESWYLVGTQDKVLPPAQQDAMAARAESTVVRVKAGHLAMISRPGAVSNLIVDAATSAD